MSKSELAALDSLVFAIKQWFPEGISAQCGLRNAVEAGEAVLAKHKPPESVPSGPCSRPPQTLVEAEAKARAVFETSQLEYSRVNDAHAKAVFAWRRARKAYRKAQERVRDAKLAVCQTCGGSKRLPCPYETMNGDMPVCHDATCPPGHHILDGGYCVVSCPDCSGD